MSEKESTVELSDHPAPRQPRAAKACRRCHRKKLRCHGGDPCASCKRAHQSCDFGDSVNRGEEDGGKQHEDDRFAQLERMVQTLLNRMGSNAVPGNGLVLPNTQIPAAIPPAPLDDGIPTQAILASQAMPTDFAPTLFFTPSSPQFEFQRPSRPSIPTETSPVVHPTHHQNSPAGRLALASDSEDRVHAPLRALAFNPAHWENVDRTRPPSPVREPLEQMEGFWTTFEARPGLQDDPISLGLVTEDNARALVDIFLRYCHPFLPILEFVRPPTERCTEIREMGPYLFTTVLAVAARFKSRNGSSQIILPVIEPEASLKIRRLAYSHFASCGLRRHHSLRDVQATLFVAGWGMHGSYEGPESWMSTGICGRLAHRLGLHKLGKAPITRTLEGKTQVEVVKLMGQWKTWLCWWCFDTSIELGFGRPTTSFTQPDETGFLELVNHTPPEIDTTSALYLIGLTRLLKIGREMNRWLQILDDQDEVTKTLSDIRSMLQQMNSQLDEWSQTWLWKGSSYHLRLGRFSRLIKLQSEHIRLSLNSLALKSTYATALQNPPTDLSGYISTASMAAIDMVQAYVESAGSDQYLSFSLDYICLTIGHALVFLIRLSLYTQSVPIERSVIIHYLESATELMASSDMSINGQAAHVARTCRDLCRAAGIPLPSVQCETHPITDLSMDMFMSSDFTMDTSLFAELNGDQTECGWLFGLPSFALSTEDGEGAGIS